MVQMCQLTILVCKQWEKKQEEKSKGSFLRKKCHPENKQFLLKVLLFSGVQLSKVCWGI